MRHTDNAVLTAIHQTARDQQLDAYTALDAEPTRVIMRGEVDRLKQVLEGLEYLSAKWEHTKPAYKRRLTSRTQRRIIRRLLTDLAVEIDLRRNGNRLTEASFRSLDETSRFLHDELKKLTPKQKPARQQAHGEVANGLVPGFDGA